MSKRLDTPPSESPLKSWEPSYSSSPSRLRQSSVSLSSKPGVYWFLDKKNNVLYVGKAKHLKKRLLSYTRLKGLLPKTAKLVERAKRTAYIETENELQALLLEAELIRTYQPLYNARLKDDKSPLYIGITDDTYPRIETVRRTNLNNSHYQHIFGPYPSSGQVKLVLRTLRTVFPWCKSPLSGRPCFYYHLEQCPGACIGKVTPQAYRRNIRNIVAFLKGDHRGIQKRLQKDIKRFAETKKFEQAADTKHTLESIQATVNNFHLKKRWQYLPNLPQDQSKARLIDAKQIITHYHPLPRDFTLKRIECFDVSHIHGRHATASMVVAINGKSNKSAYRRFKIRGLKTPNDPHMLKEAVRRRLKHPEWDIPNLIVLDGGRSQLSVVKPILSWDVPLIGLAKDPDRLVFINQEGTHSHPLEPGRPATQLFSLLRNESHRFAQSYFHKLQEKAISDAG